MLRKVSRDALFVSTPPPSWFGNGPNPESDPHWTQPDWLTSRFHFAFAEYRNPRNSQFGVLRVCNDDIVQPARQFGKHPHRDMEIATYVVDGELTHEHEAKGSAARESLGRGSVQYMSAGTGVTHSEANESPENICRFLQLWILPRRSGLPVKYGGWAGNLESRLNRFQHLVQDVENPEKTAPIEINQDANIFVAEFDKSDLSFDIAQGRQAYMVNIEGETELSCNGTVETFQQHDAAEIKGAGTCIFKSTGTCKSHVLIVEMAQDASSRFS